MPTTIDSPRSDDDDDNSSNVRSPFLLGSDAEDVRAQYGRDHAGNEGNGGNESEADVYVKAEIDTGEVAEGFSWVKLWKYMGPGWLMSIAYLDPGNLESDLQAGAVAGFSLLWLLLWAHIAGLVIQILAARLGVVTGKHLAQLIRAHYSRNLSFLIWTFTELAIIGSDIQEIVGTAIAFKIIFDLWLPVGVLLTACDTFTFMLLQQYGVRKLEAFFMVLIGTMAVCFWVEMVSSRPDILQIIEGIVVPRVPQKAVVQAVAMLGAVIMPHNMYLHSALVMSRDLGSHPTLRKLREANFYFALESGAALLISYLINLALVVSFAQVYFSPDLPEGTPLPGLYDAVEVLTRVLGPAAKYLWAGGLLAAGQSSTMTGTLAGQYVIEGFFGAIFKKQWHRVAITRAIALVPSMLVAVFAVEHFDTMGELLNVLQSICLPTALIPILKLTSSASIMSTFRTPTAMVIVCWALALIITGFNVYLFISYLEHLPVKWIGIVIGAIYLAFLAYLVYIPVLGMEEIDGASGDGWRSLEEGNEEAEREEYVGRDESGVVRDVSGDEIVVDTTRK